VVGVDAGSGKSVGVGLGGGPQVSKPTSALKEQINPD